MKPCVRQPNRMLGRVVFRTLAAAVTPGVLLCCPLPPSAATCTRTPLQLLYMVGLPFPLRWGLRAYSQLLHQHTRRKIRICRATGDITRVGVGVS